MTDLDKIQFKDLFIATMSIYGQEVTKEVMRIWWASLSAYDINQVQEAFSRHIQDHKNGKFSPKPADIIAMLQAANPDGRIGADEAWAIYPHDEYISAVITNEMAEAMQSARPLLNEGDLIGARMAFKDAYNRIVASNKFNGIAPKWFPSLGTDKAGREEALKLAVQKGRITQDHALSLLPAKTNPAITEVIGLLSNKSELTPEQLTKNRQRLAEIKTMLSGSNK